MAENSRGSYLRRNLDVVDDALPRRQRDGHGDGREPQCERNVLLLRRQGSALCQQRAVGGPDLERNCRMRQIVSLQHQRRPCSARRFVVVRLWQVRQPDPPCGEGARVSAIGQLLERSADVRALERNAARARPDELHADREDTHARGRERGRIRRRALRRRVGRAEPLLHLVLRPPLEVLQLARAQVELGVAGARARVCLRVRSVERR
eukprot:1517827-Pleurochrysis_carterae.AAC.3